MMRSLLALILVVSFVGAEPANGQSLTEMDSNVEQALDKHPDMGILIIDAVMRDAKGQPMGCLGAILSLVNAASLKVYRVKISEHKWIGDDLEGGIVLVDSGMYVAAGFTCNIGRNYSYRGGLAKVVVHPREIVAAGTLVIDYNKEGFVFGSVAARAHAEDFGPKTLASLKKRLPVTLAKARKSPLTVLSDLERKNGVVQTPTR